MRHEYLYYVQFDTAYAAPTELGIMKMYFYKYGAPTELEQADLSAVSNCNWY